MYNYVAESGEATNINMLKAREAPDDLSPWDISRALYRLDMLHILIPSLHKPHLH